MAIKANNRLLDDIVTSCAIQSRVIWALLLRETQTRFGQSNVGFFWVMLEPLFHTALFSGMFIFLNRSAPIGDSIFLFLITSFIPFFLFQDLSNKTMNAISANQSLLEYPVVKNTDVILARIILEILTYFVVGIIIFILCTVFSLQNFPTNPTQFFFAIVSFVLLGIGLGTIGAVVSILVPVWSKIIALLMRFIYFFSGIMFSVSHLPPEYQIYFLYNPITHAVEMMREGFYFGFTSQVLSYSYLYAWAFTLVFLGFTLEVLLRKSVKNHK